MKDIKSCSLVELIEELESRNGVLTVKLWMSEDVADALEWLDHVPTPDNIQAVIERIDEALYSDAAEEEWNYIYDAVNAAEKDDALTN